MPNLLKWMSRDSLPVWKPAKRGTCSLVERVGGVDTSKMKGLAECLRLENSRILTLVMLSVGEEALMWGVAPFAERVRVMFPNGVRDANDEEVTVVDGEGMAGADVKGS